MIPSDPAVAAPKKRMTANEFWEFVHRPENETRSFELRKGEVVELSRPTVPHCRICSRISYLIEKYAEGVSRGYVLTNDPGVLLEEDPDTVVGPDVSYFTDVNTFEELTPKWAETPPILVVEVRSPNDRPNTLIAKARDYLNGGVKLVWLVDYEERSVSVFRPDRTPEVISELQELTGGDEIPGFSVRVAEFFRMPGDPRSPPQPPPPTA